MSKPTDDSKFEGTRVDLGDDLLQSDASSSSRDAIFLRTDSGQSPEDRRKNLSDYLQDEIQSAKILVSEGLTEEAKKILRKILRLDPSNIVARKALEEIHETELKQIFGEERRRRRVTDSTSADPTFFNPYGATETDEMVRRLDEDLGLDIHKMSLFEDAAGMAQFSKKMDEDLKSLSPSERLDVGIAFLEMGLCELAINQFDAACRSLMKHDKPSDQSVYLSAASLLALAMIKAGKPFEATLRVQPVLSDIEISKENKIEFFYLMGVAYEGLKKPDIARHWYGQVHLLDPFYRDVQERLREKNLPAR